MNRVPFRVHLGTHEDETSAVCHWHIPEAHYLETWGDVRSPDGTVSIVQPLIAPLFNGKSALEMLALLTDNAPPSSRELVTEFWRQRLGFANTQAGSGFDNWWRETLHDGLVAHTKFAARPVTLRDGWRVAGEGWRVVDDMPATPHPPPTTRHPPDGLEIVFRPDPTIFDGRFANNGWLQELPKPLSQADLGQCGLYQPDDGNTSWGGRTGHPEEANGKVVELEYAGRKVSAPLWILPGHADDSVTVHLGYGRQRAGKIGTGPGFDAYTLRTAAAPWFAIGPRESIRPAGAWTWPRRNIIS